MTGWFFRELRGGTRKDPSLTARHVKVYEKALAAMIRGVEREVLSALKSFIYVKSDMRVAEMSEYTLDLTAFKRKVGHIITVRFREPARIAGNDAIRGQVTRGAMRADQFLSMHGIDIRVGDMPIDNRTLTLLSERNLTELMGIANSMEKRIIEEVSNGIISGEGARGISDRLLDVFDGEENRAMRVARTETMMAFNHSAMERYKRYGVDQVRWKVGGANICDHAKGFDGIEYPGGCQGLDDQVFDIGSVPPCPLHPNCKCITQPVIERIEVE